MNYMVDFIKGGFIGVANVIPGLSGGTIAVILGVYDRLIGGISDILKKPKEVLKDLIFLLLGLLVGIVVALYVVVYFLDKFPLPTTLLFVGFILGGIPKVYSLVSNQKPSWIHISLLLLFASTIIVLPLLSSGELMTPSITFPHLFVLLLVGVIAASAMVIPGVSGSMVLVILGFYYFITSELTNFIKHFLSFEFGQAVASLPFLLPFGVGVLFGIFGLSKLLKYLLNKHYTYVYYAILGLIIASPIPIFLLMNETTYELLNIILGVVMLVIGLLFSYNMTRLKELIFKDK
jgi:putative membrane protein